MNEQPDAGPREVRQSDAEPVAYDRAWNAVMHSPELALTRRKLAEDELGLLIKVVAASLYAPPRPDASAGLIEAAEWHEAQASAWERPNSSSSSAWPAIIAREHRKFAEYFRARAADRSA